MDLKRKMVRALVLAALASSVVYAALIVVSDGEEVAAALKGFPLSLFVLMVGASTSGYLVRAWRWGRFLAIFGHKVSAREAAFLQLSSLTMSISPGRLGELLKAWLSREVCGLPVSRGIALVFAERLADLIAVCLLALGGLSVLEGGAPWLVAGVLAVGAGTAIAGSAWFHGLVLRLMSRQSWAAKHLDSAETLSETVRVSLRLPTLSWSVVVSVVAWGVEGLGFWLALNAFGFDELGAAGAVSVYAVATIVGAFTFLPGGIGLTEASMAGVLVALGMDAASASAATLLIRVATLWWGVALGWMAIALSGRYLAVVFGERAQQELCEP